MKTLFAAIISAGMMCAISLAQDASAPTASPAPRIASGSVIPVRLTRSIDAKKAKAGDEVEAKVTEDLKTTNGTLLMAKDTKVVGHVTAAQARTKEQKESQLAIGFDHAVMKSGDVAMPMSIQAIIAVTNPNSDANSSSGSLPSSPQAIPDPSTNMKGGPGVATAGPPAAEPNTTAHWPGSDGPAAKRPPITDKTAGVVGFENLKLAAQGSVVSSDKSNVKLDSGTMMLLRVN